jgi:sporulation protein YlmC with PRC-barrel domain
MSYLERDTLGIYKTHKGPGPHLMGANTLIGDNVVNRQSEDLGEIKEIMLDMRTGKVAYAVMSFGGFLGMGDKLFAVPWTALTLDTLNERFVLNVEKEHLANAPGFEKDAWPDMNNPAWVNELHSYYGTKAYQDSPL